MCARVHAYLYSLPLCVCVCVCACVWLYDFSSILEIVQVQEAKLGNMIGQVYDNTCSSLYSSFKINHHGYKRQFWHLLQRIPVTLKSIKWICSRWGWCWRFCPHSTFQFIYSFINETRSATKRMYKNKKDTKSQQWSLRTKNKQHHHIQCLEWGWGVGGEISTWQMC